MQPGGCCPVDQLRAWKAANPGYAIVSYINTSVEVKAESDILCTSRNAVKIVNSIPADQPVMFLPDINLGNYVQRADRPPQHENLAGRVHRARDLCGAQAGQAARASIHTRWWPRIRNAPRTCSQWPTSSAPRRPSSIGAPLRTAEEFIVMTESGVRYSLEKLRARQEILFRRRMKTAIAASART